MKTEHKILITLISILLIVGIIIFLKDYFTLKNKIILYTNPFEKIQVLEKDINLNEEQKEYNITLDCSSLEPNRQIVFYDLKEEYKDSKISVHIKIMKENEILTEDYEGATDLDILLTKEQDNYELIYNIKAICE